MHKIYNDVAALLIFDKILNLLKNYPYIVILLITLELMKSFGKFLSKEIFIRIFFLFFESDIILIVSCFNVSLSTK